MMDYIAAAKRLQVASTDSAKLIVEIVATLTAHIARQDALLIDLQATIKKLSDELGRREPEEGVDA